VKADPDVIAVIDSILAEAGDPRAKLGLCWRIATVQGWVDRLRGIRAALEASNE
jgi:aminoglycoside phosphotransferase (APT) family kinase protein